MTQTPLILLLALSLPLSPLLVGQAEAGKGRGYSSGGSSSRSSGRSYSSGRSSGGRSSSTPSFSRSSSAPKPARSSFDSAAAAAQRRQESRKSYTTRGTPSPRGGFTPPKSSYPTSKPSGRTYSGGGAFDTTAAAAQRRQESKAAFTKGTAPRPTYTTPGGETRRVDPGDKRVEQIRRETSPRRWATRQERRYQVFPNPSPPPVVIYHDPYSNWFWWWLLTQNRDTRAWWAYHHQSDMDAARYRDLLAKDQQLEARIRELEAKKEPRDPTYAPPGLDPDLMYDDSFVEAAVNPQPPPSPPPAPARRVGGAVWRIALILAGMAFLVWLVFIKRWGGD